MTPELTTLIRELRLASHPEGGFYREWYRAAGTIPASALPPRYGGERAYATSILYLLPAGARSRWHRVASDELWHLHRAGPLKLSEIAPDGAVRTTTLGTDVTRAQTPVHAVAAGHWFGARPAEGATFALASCTVAPGFTFADLELGDPTRLTEAFPHLAPIIRALG